MNKTAGIFGLLVLLFGYFSYEVKTETLNASSLAFSQGDKIESFTLPSRQDSSVTLDTVISQSKYVWVNFWATWCGPCRREMPMMTELYNKYSDQGFSIVAVSVGEDSSTVNSYLKENPVPFTVLLDGDRKVSNRFNIEALPTSFLVDSTGQIIRSGVGVQSNWDFVISNKYGDMNVPFGNTD
jgi:thiol-disulfide isomerase/thioredoxin